MFLFSLLLYFVAAVLAIGLVVLPEVRQRLFDGCARVGRRGTVVIAGWRFGLARAGSASCRSAGTAGDAIRRHLVEHWLLWSGGSALLILAVALGAGLAWRSVLSFDDGSRDVDEKVEALLRGEQLVPPAPLPPELFATAEVEMVRPLTREGSRDWAAFDADFRNRLLLVYKIMKEQYGYDMALLEGYRSPERQARLAALGPQVTRAGANQSFHQHGLAADSAFLRQGRLVISEQDAWALEGYRRYGDAAESLGLVWGGRWSFRDYGHVEYRKPGFKLPRS